jgi:hypothetical protein
LLRHDPLLKARMEYSGSTPEGTGLAMGGTENRRRGARLLALCIAGWLIATASHAAAGPGKHRSGVGVNLGAWVEYSTDLPSIDQFKRARAWLTQCVGWSDPNCKGFDSGGSAFDTREQALLDLDEHGWVRSLTPTRDRQAKFTTVSALLFHGDGGVRPAGRYTVLYDGKGTVEYGLAGRRLAKESRPGRDIVEVSGSKDAGLLISIVATDPRNHLRNFRVLPPGGVCEQSPDLAVDGPEACREPGKGAFVPYERFPASRQWHPRYVQDLTGFRAVRFLDWARTNESTLASWADRTRPDTAVWTGEHGVPVDAMLDLSNVVRADPWINLPSRANDDYARQFARTAKALLAPERVLYLEYGNEPWNFGFPNAGWLTAQAQALWPAGRTREQNPYVLTMNWYAQRAAKLCQIVKEEFGLDAHRVRCVANVQAASPWNIEQILACPLAAKDLGRPCSKHFDAVAVAPYFGGYISDTKGRPVAGNWMREADGGLGALFSEILGERDGSPAAAPFQGALAEGTAKGALAQTAGWMTGAKAVTDRFGLPLLAYEGGQHMTVNPTDQDERWLRLLTAANRDPRMGRAYGRLLADWRQAGGQLFMYYSHVGQASKFGFWGLKESHAANGDPKWKAALAYRDDVPCWWAGCSP